MSEETTILQDLMDLEHTKYEDNAPNWLRDLITKAERQIPVSKHLDSIRGDVTCTSTCTKVYTHRIGTEVMTVVVCPSSQASVHIKDGAGVEQRVDLNREQAALLCVVFNPYVENKSGD